MDACREPHLPVESSILAADGLADGVLRRYGFHAPVRCRLASRALNDTYRVEAGDAAFYLRVSPHGWRTEPEIAAELAWVADLHRRGLRVARPIPRDDGSFIARLAAPEGERHAVLFAAAAGTDAREITPTQARAYGRLAAAIHDAADATPRAFDRFHLDERHLLDEPMVAIRARMVECGEDLAYLEETAARIRPRLAALSRTAPA